MTAGYLLDTNVISATAPDRRDVLPPEKAAIRAWMIANEARLMEARPAFSASRC